MSIPGKILPWLLVMTLLSILTLPGCTPGRSDKSGTGDESPPNIVLILADDLGYGDLSCYGAKDYMTPHLDRLAAEGIRFTNFLVPQAVCSASRAGLMTGCYPNRVGIRGALMPWSETGLHPGEETIAEILEPAGYRSIAIGKWHLGHLEEFLPQQHGFDEYFGLPYSNDMWPVNDDGTPATPETNPRKARHPNLPLIEGTEKIRELTTLEDQAQLTTLYTERAVRFIREQKGHPFFLYLAHSMPHVPLAVSEKFKGKSRQGLYGDVIMEVDWSVGEVIRTLEEEGLTDRTLVIFTSDNGPWLSFGNHGGSSGGLREGKLTSFEGGHRVPCIVRWPGVAPGGTICNHLASTIDLLPTFASIAGVPLPVKTIDGVDILPLLEGEKGVQPRHHFYYYLWNNHLEAVRYGEWKLVLPHQYRSYEAGIPGRDGKPGKTVEMETGMALFDLRRDPGERYDVRQLNPGIEEELTMLVEKARADLGDAATDREGMNRRDPGSGGH